jgi:hypothetical protein
MRTLETYRLNLLKAADYIEEHGWCQNRPVTNDGRVCMTGAMLMVLCGTPYLQAATSEAWMLQREGYQAVLESLSVDPLVYPIELAAWNDAEGRSKDEVVQALRYAAMRGL